MKLVLLAVVFLLPLVPGWSFAAACLSKPDDVANVVGVVTILLMAWWLYLGSRLGVWIHARSR